MSQLSTLVALLTLAAPAPAAEKKAPAKATISIQAIEARPGKNRTGEGIDPKLARKLRVTLEVMGVSRPDLKSLARSSKGLAKGESASVSVPPYTLEVTCKAVGEDSATVTAELFQDKKDPKTRKIVRKSMTRTSAELKGDQVLPLTPAQSGKAKKIFVVSRAGAGG